MNKWEYFLNEHIEKKKIFEEVNEKNVANVLYYDTVVSEFEFYLRYDVHFLTNTLRKGMSPFILAAIA